MDLKELYLCFFLFLIAVADAIKCKCTKESETVTCYDGVCEMEGGSCLMLDHPSMGIHYTCHTKGLKDGSCRNKTSKSGAAVRICGCESTDFCNYSYWPDKSHSARSIHQRHRQQAEEQQQQQDAVSSSKFTILPIIFLIPFIAH